MSSYPGDEHFDYDRERIRKIDADRVAAGVCRHCGGDVPCWSESGDVAIGRRHTAATLKKHRNKTLLRDAAQGKGEKA